MYLLFFRNLKNKIKYPRPEDKLVNIYSDFSNLPILEAFATAYKSLPKIALS